MKVVKIDIKCTLQLKEDFVIIVDRKLLKSLQLVQVVFTFLHFHLAQTPGGLKPQTMEIFKLLLII